MPTLKPVQQPSLWPQARENWVHPMIRHNHYNELFIFDNRSFMNLNIVNSVHTPRQSSIANTSEQTHQSTSWALIWTSVSGFLIINIFKYKDYSFEQMIEFEMFQHIYTVLYINLNHFKRIQYYMIKVSFFCVFCELTLIMCRLIPH